MPSNIPVPVRVPADAGADTHPVEPRKVSRRALLANAALTGAAIAATPTIARAAAGPPADGIDDVPAAAPGDPVVAHVRSVRSGLIDVYVGERHVEVRDRDLARRITELGR